MTLTELRYVVAVARERHFGRAASACFVSQPTLSAGVKRLEDELEVALFERQQPEVKLTPVGQRVVAQAEIALQQAQLIKSMAAEGKDPLRGALRLGVIYTIGPFLLPRFIPLLSREAPDLTLIVEENFTTNLAEQLKRGELDMIVVSTPFEEPGVNLELLYKEPLTVALPKNHKLGSNKRIKADDLIDETLLLLKAGNCFRDQVMDACPACKQDAFSKDKLQKTLEGSLHRDHQANGGRRHGRDRHPGHRGAGTQRVVSPDQIPALCQTGAGERSGPGFGALPILGKNWRNLSAAWSSNATCPRRRQRRRPATGYLITRNAAWLPLITRNNNLSCPAIQRHKRRQAVNGFMVDRGDDVPFSQARHPGWRAAPERHDDNPLDLSVMGMGFFDLPQGHAFQARILDFEVVAPSLCLPPLWSSGFSFRQRARSQTRPVRRRATTRCGCGHRWRPRTGFESMEMMMSPGWRPACCAGESAMTLLTMAPDWFSMSKASARSGFRSCTCAPM